MAIEFNTRIRDIPLYPAADGYALGEHVALLASNESPEAPLPEVVAAAQRAAAGANRYPDPSASILRSRLSDRYGIPTTRISLGNGSCEILLAAGQALLEPGAEFVYAWPSFSIYPQVAAAAGGTPITVPLNDRHEHDLDAMLEEITAATRLVVVCNPNNPTSTALSFSRIKAFVEQVPSHIAVILDEAYCEYSTLDDPDATLDLLDDHPNLVLLRTFSKVYGLAGLRVGFGLCGSEAFVSAVNQVRQPFYVNVAAQAAAVEALKHGDAVVERVERAIAARLHIEEGLAALGMQVADSQANFVWFDLPADADEAAVITGLRERDVLVRAGTALGRAGALRVSFGPHEHNQRFLDVLAELL